MIKTGESSQGLTEVVVLFGTLTVFRVLDGSMFEKQDRQPPYCDFGDGRCGPTGPQGFTASDDVVEFLVRSW